MLKLFCHHWERRAKSAAVCFFPAAVASWESAKSAPDISRVSAAPPQALDTDGM